MTRRRAPSSFWRTVILVGVCTFLGGAVLGVWVAPRLNQPPLNGTVSAAADAGASPREHGSTISPRPHSPFPVGLEIPAIAVATPLVGLGLTADRTVEVPHNPDRAGWFHRGPPPGQRGSAVILGHVDSTQGPAVFARLQELRAGDVVIVDRANGTTVHFVVRKSAIYDNDEFPANRVYAAQGGRRLNLVTCGGIYDSTRGGYQSNLVVYTRLVRN